MERFIVISSTTPSVATGNLKSSMERFIVDNVLITIHKLINLKSSMERFIELELKPKKLKEKFKIQYGEIYRKIDLFLLIVISKFKIQYGEIYST